MGKLRNKNQKFKIKKITFESCAFWTPAQMGHKRARYTFVYLQISADLLISVSFSHGKLLFG